jgi:hypothetical protein
MSSLDHATLHHAILTSIVERGFAPESEELAERFGATLEQIEQALRALHEDHGVVLHPFSAEIWVAHPFSCAPTGHVLRRGERTWWSNCGWCSLGAAALLGGEVSIFTTLGGEDRQVELRVVDGELVDRDFVVHFPIPMTRAWDNVVYTCSTMLVFEDRQAVDAWCERHRIERGDVQPIANVAAFAAVWYGRHLDRDWKKWTNREANEIFERFGLNHEVWKIPGGEERF